MPDEVLIDWFQEQPVAASEWGFLDLQGMTWVQETFSLKNVPGAETFRGG
jgi:hypothetical protein